MKNHKLNEKRKNDEKDTKGNFHIKRVSKPFFANQVDTSDQ